VAFILLPAPELFAVERRPVKEVETSWYVYPLTTKVPGMGELYGAGLTFANIGGSEMDVTALRAEGEGVSNDPASVEVVSLFDVPLFTEHLTLSGGKVQVTNGAAEFYSRGADSSKDDKIIYKASKVDIGIYDLSLNFFDYQLELYYGVGSTAIEPKSILKPMGGGGFREFEIPEGQRQDIKRRLWRVGMYWDNTDNRRDPRVGTRLQVERWYYPSFMKADPAYSQNDVSWTGFWPTVDENWNVVVFNLFYSYAELDKPGIVDQADYQCEGKKSVCSQIQPALDQLYEEATYNANHGKATSLGGLNRLRGYPTGRFYDNYTFFAGLENRFYMVEDYQPFNYFVQKGVFTGLQFAAFVDAGQVSPTPEKLLGKLKTTYGMGVRVLLNTVVIRLDQAYSDEGRESMIFVGYPF